MIMDSRVEFADAVSVAAAAGTALIGNQIDLTTARDLGNGGTLYLAITTDTEIITGGVAGTVQFQLVSDDTAAIATNGTASVHFSTKAFVTGNAASNDPQLNVGGVIAMVELPMEGVVYERFLGILAITATTTTTAGKINAFLTRDPRGWKSYADAVN
jgi:hypothetical protein